MKASVIVPCHPRNKPNLPRTLNTLETAARGLDVEILVIDDPAARGASWARNRGLEKAVGEFVFFCDADDEVRTNFFTVPLAQLHATQADFCLFSGEGDFCLYSSQHALKREACEWTTKEAVRDALLPAFFGFSLDDVRRWNAGGDLRLHKQPGSVCLAAFRRDFLEAHAIRFDEAMTMYEDAAFLASASAVAHHVVSCAEDLYVYRPQPNGNMTSGLSSRRHWDYKLAALAFRQRLDMACGGELWRYCEASCVFSILELLRLRRAAGVSYAEARQAMGRYLSDARVRAAVRAFPLSVWHPLVALAVWALRRRCA